jgi:hypothetical protein
MSWLEYLLTVDWVPSGKTALSALVGAGLGSAIVQGAFSLVAEWRRRTYHATYLAMRIAVLLDTFGLACSDLIGSNASAEYPPDDEFPYWDTKLPELPPFAEDIEGWVSLDRALASRCLQLRGQIRARQRVIDATLEYNMDGLEETVAEEVAHMGLEARRLALDLQRRYRLNPAGDEYAASLAAVKTKAKAKRGLAQQRLRSADPVL